MEKNGTLLCSSELQLERQWVTHTVGTWQMRVPTLAPGHLSLQGIRLNLLMPFMRTAKGLPTSIIKDPPFLWHVITARNNVTVT